MPRFEFQDKDTGFNYVTYTPNLDIAIRNAKINGFREDQLISDTGPFVGQPYLKQKGS